MFTCENCKLIVEPGTVYCPRCGRKLNLQTASKKQARASSAEVQTLLSQARSSKARAAWEDAIEKCMDALKKDPESSDTYIVLGEIYEAQGRFDQALQWYQMAESELSSLGAPVPVLREKIRKLESRRSSSHPTTGWFDRYVTGPGFNASLRVLTFAMVGFLILLVLGAATIIYTDRTRDRKMNAPHQNVSAPAPKEDNSGKPVIRQPENLPPAAPPVPAQPVTPEQKLASMIMADPPVASRRIVVNEVVVDPRNKQMVIQFTMPQPSSPPTKAQVLEDAKVVCSAAYDVNGNADFLKVAALVELPDSSGTRKLWQVFIADTNRQTITGAPAPVKPEELEKLFINPWWNPEVPIAPASQVRQTT